MSQLTDRWNVTFPVTNEEVIDDELIRFVIDAGERLPEIVAAFERSEEIIEMNRTDGNRLVVTKRSCGALPVIYRGLRPIAEG